MELSGFMLGTTEAVESRLNIAVHGELLRFKFLVLPPPNDCLRRLFELSLK